MKAGCNSPVWGRDRPTCAYSRQTGSCLPFLCLPGSALHFVRQLARATKHKDLQNSLSLFEAVLFTLSAVIMTERAHVLPGASLPPKQSLCS